MAVGFSGIAPCRPDLQSARNRFEEQHGFSCPYDVCKSRWTPSSVAFTCHLMIKLRPYTLRWRGGLRTETFVCIIAVRYGSGPRCETPKLFRVEHGRHHLSQIPRRKDSPLKDELILTDVDILPWIWIRLLFDRTKGCQC